jgi:hypothetical protein
MVALYVELATRFKPTKISLGWRHLIGSNALAYSAKLRITLPKIFMRCVLECIHYVERCHDTRHNDTRRNDTQQNDTRHNDTWSIHLVYPWHNDTQYKIIKKCDSQHNDTRHNDTQYCTRIIQHSAK